MRPGLPRHRVRRLPRALAPAAIGVALTIAGTFFFLHGQVRADYSPLIALDGQGNDVSSLLFSTDGQMIPLGGPWTAGRSLETSLWDGYVPPGSKPIRVTFRIHIPSCTQGFRLDIRLNLQDQQIGRTELRAAGSPKTLAWDITRHVRDLTRDLDNVTLGLWQADGSQVETAWLDRIWIEVAYRGHWWDARWRHRRPIRISRVGNEILSDHQVLVRLDTRALIWAGTMSARGDDIRFLDQDDRTELAYWIEHGLGTNDTHVWVRVPDLPPEGRTIFLYHGNRKAKPRSDGASTFVYYSSFESDRPSRLGEAFVRYEGNPLDIEMYNASGVVHPDVLYLPESPDGYRFWMYYTPYPPDSAELPCLVRSKDGVVFTDKGVANPLLEAGEAGQWDDGLLADPDVLKVGDTWYLYYAARSLNKSWQSIGLAISDDGKRFRKVEDNPVLSADTQLYYESHGYLMSPTVIHNESGFYMWYFSEGALDQRTLVWMCGARSPDGVRWTKLAENPLMEPVANSPEAKGIWHGDVMSFQGSLWLYYVAYDGSDMQLSLARSANGVSWNRFAGNPILGAVPHGWEGFRTYRASPILVGGQIWLYYSAYDCSYVYRIGLARSWEGIRVDFPDLGGWESAEGDVRGSQLHARDSAFSLRLVGSHPYPKVKKSLGGLYEYAIWYYDDGTNASGYLAALRVSDSESRFVGVGACPMANLTHYVYHGYPLRYQSTGVRRSVGWHRLSVRVGPSYCSFLVDGREVARTTALEERKITSVSIEGYLQGSAYFDDFTVRVSVPSEPVTQVLAAHRRSAKIPGFWTRG